MRWSKLKAGALSISTKLGLAFGAALLLSIGIGLFSLHELRAVNAATHEIREHWLPKQKALANTERSAIQHKLIAERLLSLITHREREKQAEALSTAARMLALWRDDYLQRDRSAEEVFRFSLFERNWESYLTALQDAFALREEERFGDARRLFNTEANAAFFTAVGSLRQLLDYGDHNSKEAEIEAGRTYERAIRLILGAIVVAGLLTTAAVWWVGSTISAPLRRVTETMRRLANGEEARCDLGAAPRRDEIGVLTKAACSYRDALIQSRRFAAEADAGRQRLDVAIRNLPVGLTMFDGEERLVVCNDQALALYGLSPEVMRPGATHSELLAVLSKEQRFSIVDADSRRKLMRRLEPFTITARSPAGRMIEIDCQPLSSGGWVALHEDVTDRLAAHEEINYLARHDRLTDLANRFSFDEALDAALSGLGDKALAVLCLDLDRFKPVNDAYGHAVGDALLQAVAKRLRRVKRESDLAGRLGGDEFALLQTTGAQPAAAIALAQRLVDALKEPFQIEGHVIDVDVSIGVALAPAHSVDGDELLRCADAALYCAKAKGDSAYCVYAPDMTFKAERLKA